MQKPQLALQLYTLRDAMEEDFHGTLDRIAKMGFTHVETAFFPEGITNQAAAQAIRDAGLSVCSAHCEIPVGEQQQPVLELVELFDCDLVIWHGWPQDPDYSSVDGVKRLAELYNQASAVCVANGRRFGVHNHWWEFEQVEEIRPYQILAAEMDPAIFFEVDTYWVKTAGVDPVDVVRELGDRAPLLHVKDGPATQDDDMVALGKGSMDFAALDAAASGSAEWLIIELDRCATDMFEAVDQSRQYLVDGGFVRG